MTATPCWRTLSSPVLCTPLSGSSFSQVLATRSSALQSGYHIQMLAMSSQLASDGIGTGFRSLARQFRWSVLGVKGSLPVLDAQFR